MKSPIANWIWLISGWMLRQGFLILDPNFFGARLLLVSGSVINPEEKLALYPSSLPVLKFWAKGKICLLVSTYSFIVFYYHLRLCLLCCKITTWIKARKHYPECPLPISLEDSLSNCVGNAKVFPRIKFSTNISSYFLSKSAEVVYSHLTFLKVACLMAKLVLLITLLAFSCTSVLFLSAFFPLLSSDILMPYKKTCTKRIW